MVTKIKLGLELTTLHTAHRTRGFGRVAQAYFEELSRRPEIEVAPYSTDEFPRSTGTRDDQWKDQLWDRWRLAWSYRTQEIDLLQIIDPMKVPPFSSAPVVTMVHDLIPYIYRERYQPNLFVQYLYWRMKRQIKSSAGVVTPSHSTAEDLAMMFAINEDRIQPIPHGIDRKRFYPRAETEIKELCQKYRLRRPYFLMVADLSKYDPRKSLEPVITRWDVEKLQEVSLVVAGKQGEYSEQLKRKWPGRRNQLIFPGYVDDNELAGLYSGASGLIFPSRYEGFGFPVLEAMACGTRPVVRTIGSVKEIIDGHAIQLEDSYFEEELVDALLELKYESDTDEKLVTHTKKYSWEKTIERLLEYYKNFLP